MVRDRAVPPSADLQFFADGLIFALPDDRKPQPSSGSPMENFGMSMLWFWAAYIGATLFGILHCIFNIYVLHFKPMDANGMGEAYEKTKPWHPVYNLLLYPLAGWLYMRSLPDPTLQEAFRTGLLWAGLCIGFDLVAWVLIRHPWRLSFREFYIRYQPWISLIYLIIFIAPFFGFVCAA